MTEPARTSSLGKTVLVSGGAWGVAYFVARGILERDDLAPSTRLVVALAPIAIFVAFLWSYLRLVRHADELERRVHLEALGVAFPLTLLLLTTLGLVQRAVTLPFEDWSYAHVAMYVPLFYVIGLGIAWRRYR